MKHYIKHDEETMVIAKSKQFDTYEEAKAYTSAKEFKLGAVLRWEIYETESGLILGIF